jgi:mRNA-degrading endonuclease RelE of RelBE toxin-antitoxin system
VNSELSPDFIKHFRRLPERVKRTAHKNYKLWKANPQHPSLEFKPMKGNENIYSIRVGIGWRAVGIMDEDENTIVWFWIGSHSEYDKL